MSAPDAQAKPGPWQLLRFLPLFMLMAPFPKALWVGLNEGTMAIPEAIRTALLQGAVALAVWALLAIALRSMIRAAVLLVLPVMVWFSLGSVARNPNLLQLSTWLLVATSLGLLLMRLRWGREIVFFANVLTAALLLQPVWLTVTFLRDSTPPRDSGQTLVATVPKERLPHIVHIVMDGFPASKILREVHGVDDSDFLGSLQKLGFRIIPDARSNYGFTLLSLSSMFEMRTIQPLIAELASTLETPPGQLEGRITRTMLSRRMEHSPVMQALRASGYRIVLAETSYPRAAPGNPDERWGPAPRLCDFTFSQYAIHKRTPLAAVCEAFAGRRLIYSRHHTLLQALTESPPVETWREPTYFYEHILAPHAPFVLEADGRYFPYSPKWELTDNWLFGRARERVYSERFPPTVQWIMTTVSRQVAEVIRRADRPVVILIHGDHGSGRHTQDTVETNCHRERFSPFLAVYSPDGRVGARLPDDADLTMLFPAVLSTQLGIDVPIRPSPSYFSAWLTPGNLVELRAADLAASCAVPQTTTATAGAPR